MSTRNERDEVGAYLDFCEQCGRYFDVRSGCEEDIRHDERRFIRSLVAGALVVGVVLGCVASLLI